MKTAIIYDKWLSGLGGGEVVACNMATVLRDTGYEITLLSSGTVSKEAIKSKLGIDLSGINITTNLDILNPSTSSFKLRGTNKPKTTSNKQQATNNQELNNQQPDLFINLSFMDYTYGFAKKNIYYVHFPSRIRSGIFNFVLIFFQKTNLQSLFPNFLKEKINDRLHAGIYPDMRKRLDSYNLFITHSKYVAAWTKTYWDKETHIVYPPIKLITTNGHQLTTKSNWIVSLGRFFTLGHGKKQEVMIEAFKQLYDKLNPKSKILNPKKIVQNSKFQISSKLANQVTNNLQLHLIGGVGNEPSSIRFVEHLKEMTKGYPIYFHFNTTRSEVEEILLKSKIYWHAAGYGEDPKKDPIKFEHFGIAPIEAISAGCIPILFDGGGLPEIIKILCLNPNFHLFNTMKELILNTKQLFYQKTTPLTVNQILQDKFSQKKFISQFLKTIPS